MLCVVGDAWNGMSPVVPVLLNSCGGSRLFGLSSSVVDSLLVLVAMSIYGIASCGVTSMCVVTSMSLSSWVCGGSWFTLVSTPVSSASPIRRTFWSVKIKCYGSPFASSFTRAMKVSGIGIISQLLLAVFFEDWRLINLNPPWVFSHGTKHIADFVLAAWIFLGVFPSCTWHYWLILRARCLV